MCAFKDCNAPGDMAPKLVFVFKDGRVPLLLGMEVCADCRPGLMRRESMRQAAARLLETTVMPMRPVKVGPQDVEMEVEWVPIDSAEYRDRDHRVEAPS